MNGDGELEAVLRALPSGDGLLALDPEIEGFYLLETGIQDSEELKKYIVEFQEGTYKEIHCRSANQVCPVGNVVFCAQVFLYPCIRGFGFAGLKVARIPAYPRNFELLKSRPDTLFLDIVLDAAVRMSGFISEFAWITPFTCAERTFTIGGRYCKLL
jgi:hypothetical protein